MNSLLENQAQADVSTKLETKGNIYQLIKELELIEQDTSPDIAQICVSCRKEFEIFQSRAQMGQDANFPKMLDELNEFEKSCASIKQKHAMQIESLKHQSHILVQELINLQAELRGYSSRKPRIEYDVTDTNQKIALSINSYQNENQSYRELRSYISQTQAVTDLAVTNRKLLEKMWENFSSAQNRTVSKLMDMKRILNIYDKKSDVSWLWAQKAYRKILKPAQNSYQKHNQELGQLTTLDITIKQAVGMCNQLQGEIDGELKAMMSKLEPIREEQEHLANRHFELVDSTKRWNMFTIPLMNSDLIREFCARAKASISAEGARMDLDMAQHMLERSLTREDGIRIIKNPGSFIDHLADRGSITDNAEKTVSQDLTEQPGDIFISYARTDNKLVQNIYAFLLESDHRPWMDIHSIKGGENWFNAISKAIEECEIFLAILSHNSVSKRGVLQKELKKALDRWEGMLPDDIFIIPIRIDDCPIPDLLKPIHVLDWDHGEGKNKLLEAIKVGLIRRRGN